MSEPVGFRMNILVISEDIMKVYKFKIFLTENMYLTYFNDFLTVSACAQHFGVTESSMRRVINYYRSR